MESHYTFGASQEVDSLYSLGLLVTSFSMKISVEKVKRRLRKRDIGTTYIPTDKGKRH